MKIIKIFNIPIISKFYFEDNDTIKTKIELFSKKDFKKINYFENLETNN